MGQEPYRSARRVFRVTDNGSSHSGEKFKQRLVQWYPNAVQVHLPVHATWLNQVEIFFSIISGWIAGKRLYASINGAIFMKVGRAPTVLMIFMSGPFPKWSVSPHRAAGKAPP